MYLGQLSAIFFVAWSKKLKGSVCMERGYKLNVQHALVMHVLIVYLWYTKHIISFAVP